VRDPTGMVQLTHRRGGEGDVLESVIEDLGGLEIIPKSVEVLNRADSPLPLDEHSGPDHRLDWRFLDVRMRPQTRLVFDVQTTVEQAMREHAFSKGFTEMHTPKLMGTRDGVDRRTSKMSWPSRNAYWLIPWPKSPTLSPSISVCRSPCQPSHFRRSPWPRRSSYCETAQEHPAWLGNGTKYPTPGPSGTPSP
jgi:hypothetical protein